MGVSDRPDELFMSPQGLPKGTLRRGCRLGPLSFMSPDGVPTGTLRMDVNSMYPIPCLRGICGTDVSWNQ